MAGVCWARWTRWTGESAHCLSGRCRRRHALRRGVSNLSSSVSSAARRALVIPLVRASSDDDRRPLTLPDVGRCRVVRLQRVDCEGWCRRGRALSCRHGCWRRTEGLGCRCIAARRPVAARRRRRGGVNVEVVGCRHGRWCRTDAGARWRAWCGDQRIGELFISPSWSYGQRVSTDALSADGGLCSSCALAHGGIVSAETVAGGGAWLKAMALRCSLVVRRVHARQRPLPPSETIGMCPVEASIPPLTPDDAVFETRRVSSSAPSRQRVDSCPKATWHGAGVDPCTCTSWSGCDSACARAEQCCGVVITAREVVGAVGAARRGYRACAEQPRQRALAGAPELWTYVVVGR